MKVLFIAILTTLSTVVFSQHGYWQQHADYTMDIDFDAENSRFSGTQKLVYTNNSPDTIHTVYYHLYYNAFQPGSQMDVRNYVIKDPEKRIGNRIQELEESDYGYHHIQTLLQDGKALDYHVEGTILEVALQSPILPGKKSTFTMEFNSQVPPVIRRSGKHNKEGIDFSMAQWYPKLAEYDPDGWHTNAYISREFYGVWSNFKVNITLDSSYTVAATGYLQNAKEIGHGYALKKTKKLEGKNAWQFYAPDVHDFMWAADRDYQHDKVTLRDGLEVHFFYQNDTLTENWDSLQYYIKDVFAIMDSTFGKYPYKQYSFIQGGDGGMEYPMTTLITGHRKLNSFMGTAVHELIHNWYYGVLANNENAFGWMDEGFTTYAEDYVMDVIMPDTIKGPRLGGSKAYEDLVDCDHQENLLTPSDFYDRNRNYVVSVYYKGSLFLNQLRYIVGDETFYAGMRRYFNTWKFKHPDPKDFLRVMEKEADMELDWFYNQWIESTNTIDYGIKYLVADQQQSKVVIDRIGRIPMPVEVKVTYKNGEETLYYIPLRLMRGEKTFEEGLTVNQLPDWPWTYPSYEITIPAKLNDIVKVEIDPAHLTVDVNRKNNVVEATSTNTIFGKE